jgi:hypothetical protein
MVAFQNKTSGVTSWEEKTINKVSPPPFSRLPQSWDVSRSDPPLYSTHQVFWRGSTTGSHYTKTNDFGWRNSHRIRLNAIANAHGDTHTDVLVETSPDASNRQAMMRRLHVEELNKHLFDVGITSVSQCDEKDGTCESAWQKQRREGDRKLMFRLIWQATR